MLLSLVLIILFMPLVAQTTHQVAVTSNVYTPKELTINAGDEVVWTNTQGHHNVNGSKLFFSGNPESFGNDLGMNWTFKHVFNLPGTYDYQCDPHVAVGMFGKIIVNKNVATSSSLIAEVANQFRLVANRENTSIEIKLPADYSASGLMKVYSITGAVVSEKQFSGNAGSVNYDISWFKKGIYILRLSSGTRTEVFRFIKH